MKKLGGALAFIVCMMATMDSSAQKVGVLLGYGTEVQSLGVGANGEFNVNSKVAISPSLIFWFPNNGDWWEANVNVHYYFTTAGTADFYGIGGVNLTSTKGDEKGADSNSEVGLNLGAGVNFNIGKSWEPFTEAKFVFSDADQLALIFGVKFRLGN